MQLYALLQEATTLLWVTCQLQWIVPRIQLYQEARFLMKGIFQGLLLFCLHFCKFKKVSVRLMHQATRTENTRLSAVQN